MWNSGKNFRALRDKKNNPPLQVKWSVPNVIAIFNGHYHRFTNVRAVM
jgi:hypothetical protein